MYAIQEFDKERRLSVIATEWPLVLRGHSCAWCTPLGRGLAFGCYVDLNHAFSFSLVSGKNTAFRESGDELNALDVSLGPGKARKFSIIFGVIVEFDAPINTCDSVHRFKVLTALKKFSYRVAAISDDGICGSRHHFVSAVNVP